MRRYPPPLGTTFFQTLGTWAILKIGTGKFILPPHGENWTKRQAMEALRREQGREVPVVSPQLRRVKTADVA